MKGRRTLRAGLMAQMEELRCLTIRNPMAMGVALGLKPIENRDSESMGAQAYRLVGRVIGIHAAKTWDRDDVELFAERAESRAVSATLCAATAGKIVAVACIDRVVELLEQDPANRSRWRTKTRFGIVFRDVVRLEAPVPARGALGFWPVEGRVVNAVRKAL